MDRKKRILWCGESSYLSTGYATYSLEVLKRLHDTGKYEIFELGCYGEHKDQRSRDIPWRFISNMPNPENEKETELYYSVPTYQFGEWKFEESCLRALPDVVCDIRDHWMLSFQESSPFRPFYNSTIMPTCDAAPQSEEWISTFINADAVFTYNDWSLEVLNKQSLGKIKTKGTASPGADILTLKPNPEKKKLRSAIGIDENCFIVGTVMRNQRRKLYPDLIQAFKDFIQKSPEELAKKTYLYLHTSWPDLGWDIPKLITEAGISHKCIFTYSCRNCGVSYPNFFSDVKSVCRTCGQESATFPNSHIGVSRKTLGDIINLFDVYVQYANSEGFGMPMVEAAACGIPVMAVDYSAMSDVVRKLNGFPIKVQRMYREPETHCWRALPDNADFVDKLIAFFKLPESVRARKGYLARKAVEEYYTYDKTAKVWENHFDSLEAKPLEKTWKSAPRIHNPLTNIPNGLSEEEFVRWGIINVSGRPELLNTYMNLRMSRDLNWGATLPNLGGIYFNENSTLGSQQKLQPFDRETCLKELVKICEQKNHWERKRASL